MGGKIAFAAAVAVAACGAAPDQTVQGHFTICREQRQPDCVVDGDTIQVDDVRIQLSDIDAPDTWRPSCEAQREMGERAARRLAQLLNAGPFQLESHEARDHDGYGRELRVAVRGGRSLGDVLMQEGLARPWRGAREDWCR
ncbi:MAG TPA: thermonuclease family protein [Rhizomicrobium sp.]|jgi:endonuclease YncB( thermonuclease family)